MKNPRCLSISLSDPTGRGGVQADLGTFSDLGCRGTTVVTTVTSQTSQRVLHSHRIPTEVVASQLDSVITEGGVDAVHIGLLPSAKMMGIVSDRLADHGVDHVVVQPNLTSPAGGQIHDDDAVGKFEKTLLPRAEVLVVSCAELARMTGRQIAGTVDVARAHKAATDRGARWVVVVDPPHGAATILGSGDGKVVRVDGPRLDRDANTVSVFSGALTAELARGDLSMPNAVRAARAYVTNGSADEFP